MDTDPIGNQYLLIDDILTSLILETDIDTIENLFNTTFKNSQKIANVYVIKKLFDKYDIPYKEESDLTLENFIIEHKIKFSPFSMSYHLRKAIIAKNTKTIKKILSMDNIEIYIKKNRIYQPVVLPKFEWHLYFLENNEEFCINNARENPEIKTLLYPPEIMKTSYIGLSEIYLELDIDFTNPISVNDYYNNEYGYNIDIVIGRNITIESLNIILGLYNVDKPTELKTILRRLGKDCVHFYKFFNFQYVVTNIHKKYTRTEFMKEFLESFMQEIGTVNIKKFFWYKEYYPISKHYNEYIFAGAFYAANIEMLNFLVNDKRIDISDFHGVFSLPKYNIKYDKYAEILTEYNIDSLDWLISKDIISDDQFEKYIGMVELRYENWPPLDLAVLDKLDDHLSSNPVFQSKYQKLLLENERKSVRDWFKHKYRYKFID